MISNLSDIEKRAYNLIRTKLIGGERKPTLNEINQVTGGKSPRSASIIIDRLIKYGLLRKAGKNLRLIENNTLSDISIQTIDIPLVGTVTCGIPMLAEENIETLIPVSVNLAKMGSNYFLLRASGTSMNRAGINDGDFLLIKQQNTANNGDKVVALINDEATVKIFEKTDSAIILRPKSADQKHKPIILSDDCQIQGIVIAVLPSNLI
ncbi:MAG: repressor LexA [Bacteroidetes bacterium]|nr:repressor LexA [Bacteroidota bacterium]